jgi:hypothetical protein
MELADAIRANSKILTLPDEDVTLPQMLVSLILTGEEYIGTPLNRMLQLEHTCRVMNGAYLFDPLHCADLYHIDYIEIYEKDPIDVYIGSAIIHCTGAGRYLVDKTIKPCITMLQIGVNVHRPNMLLKLHGVAYIVDANTRAQLIESD